MDTDDTSIEGYSERHYKEWLEIPEEVQGYHHKNYYEWEEEPEEQVPPPKTFRKIIQGEEPLD